MIGLHGRFDQQFLNIPIGQGVAQVYVDGAVAGTAQVSAEGINGCAVRQLRFAADQGGGQRLTGAVDRAAIFARALAPDEVADWQSRAFG